MLLSYKWDGYGLGSLCGAIVRASLRDANNCELVVFSNCSKALSMRAAHSLFLDISSFIDFSKHPLLMSYYFTF